MGRNSRIPTSLDSWSVFVYSKSEYTLESVGVFGRLHDNSRYSASNRAEIFYTN